MVLFPKKPNNAPDFNGNKSPTEAVPIKKNMPKKNFNRCCFKYENNLKDFLRFSKFNFAFGKSATSFFDSPLEFPCFDIIRSGKISR